MVPIKAVSQLEITTIGIGSPSISNCVAQWVTVLDEFDDLGVQLTPMATVLEGEVHWVLQVVARMRRSTFNAGALRVVTCAAKDKRRDKKLTMKKSDAVREKSEK